jgi:glycosyltransferase involved in cell wall biosynthesis
MAEVIRVIFESLLSKYPQRYELCQVGLYHSYSVSKPAWQIYPTRHVRYGKDKFSYPIEDQFGQCTVREVIQSFQPDIIFAHNDPQRLLHLCCSPEKRNYKLVLYVNFDGFPVSAEIGPALNCADRIITMSEFSMNVLLACIPSIHREKVSFSYFMADKSRFKPLGIDERKSLRARIFPSWLDPEAFIFGWVGRNQWRKQVWLPYAAIHYLRRGGYGICKSCERVTVAQEMLFEQYDSQAEDLKFASSGTVTQVCRHCKSPNLLTPSLLNNVHLCIHMPNEPGHQAWNPEALQEFLRLTPDNDLYYTKTHRLGDFALPEQMAEIYQSLDALMYLSGGEGFGLPAWESMCCGVPVIFTNYSSHAEFLNIAGAGIPVGGILQPEMRTGIWRMIADMEQVIEAARRIYSDTALRNTLRSNACAFAAKFDAPSKVDDWHLTFQGLVQKESCLLN